MNNGFVKFNLIFIYSVVKLRKYQSTSSGIVVLVVYYWSSAAEIEDW